MRRLGLWGSVAVVILFIWGINPPPAAPQPNQALDCAAYETAGAINCTVSESWIATGAFPARSSRPWPPQGYELIDRALMSETDTGDTCVVAVRTLARIGQPAFSEVDGWLPWLHEGFPFCPLEERLRPENAAYGAVVRTIREVLPRPLYVIEPQSNTIVGMPTKLDLSSRSLRFDAEVSVDLPSGAKTVRIVANGTYYVRWHDSGMTTGPYNDLFSVQPTFVYTQSGETRVDVFDVWNVSVTAPGLPTFHDVVYLGYPSVGLRINELVLRVVQDDGPF